MKKTLFLSLAFFVGLGALGYPANQGQAELPANIKAIITHNCSVSGCHQGRYPAADRNYEPDKFLATVLNKPSGEVPVRKLVDTAAPEKSYLLAKIKGEPGIVGMRMPAGRDSLSAEEIQAIETWIKSLEEGSRQPGSPSETAGAGTAAASPAGKGQPAGAGKAKPKKPAFWGTRVVNLPTAETVDKGKLLFRISHRFVPAVSIGYDGFYGLDGPAAVLLSFGYGITDKLMVTVGRTNHFQEWEFYADYRVFEPSGKSALPLSGALHVGGSVVSLDQPAGEVWSGRFRFSALFSLSWQVTDRVSFLAVPGFASNTNFQQPDSENTFSLGLGGRVLVFDDFSVIGEWVPVLAGHKDNINGWGLGVEKKIGGHVFQVFATNCYGLPAAQYLIGGDLGRSPSGFFDKFRLGFNIFRTF